MVGTTLKIPSEFKNFELVLGLLLVGSIGTLVLFSSFIFPDGGKTVNLLARFTAPFQSFEHILGTDALGRDILERIVVGGKVSFSVGLLSALGAVFLGTIVGLFAGYYRGVTDVFIMRFADVQLALPFILLAITVVAILGPGLDKLIG